MDRKDVYVLIDGERAYQDKKWNVGTTETAGKHESPMDWIGFMEVYLTEAKTILAHNSRKVSYPLAMDNIRKVGALCVAAMEEIKTNPRQIK